MIIKDYHHALEASLMTLVKKENVNENQVSTFLHNILLDNLKDETNIERQREINQYLYLLCYLKRKLTKT
jgi:hypothetical protein